MGFYERLVSILDERGLKQVDLCELTGISSAQANHLVNGRTQDPKLSTAIKIADALDVSLDYLAGRKESKAVRMSRDESALLDNYRSAPPEGKATITSVAQMACGQGQDAHGSSSEEASA